METIARKFILTSIKDLESRIDFDAVKSLIIKRGLLSSAKIQAIISKELNLFEEVAKMNSPDFSVFIEILRDTNNNILADWLMNEEKCSKFYYKMNSEPLGYCIIINNVEFVNEDVELFEERMTSDQDAKNLCDMFERIGFKVIQHRNLSAEQMKDELVKFSLLDHSLLDSSVVCVLTHGTNFGGKDFLFGSDGNLIDKETIYDLFSYRNCASLLNKPKLFFFHACRLKDPTTHSKNGMLVNIFDNEPAVYYFNQAEYSIKGKSFSRSRNSGPLITLGFSEKSPKKQPELSDIFIVHSSSPGEVSVEKGQLSQPSVFCQQLVKVFNENYKWADLDSLINIITKEVNNSLLSERDKVSVHFEKNSPYGLVHFYRQRFLEVDDHIESLIKKTQKSSIHESDCLNGNIDV